MMSKNISFNQLEQLLREMNIGLSASELHGMITAWICGRGEDDSSWKRLFLNVTNVNTIIDDLFEVTAEQLADERFVFELLVPDEAQPLAFRAESFVLWCQGFLSGLGLTGVDIKLFPSLQESMEDLSELCKLDCDALMDQNEEETSFSELSEYVRTIAMFTYLEMQMKPPANRDDKNERFH